MYHDEDGSVMIDQRDLCHNCRYVSRCPLTQALALRVVDFTEEIEVCNCQFHAPKLVVLDGGRSGEEEEE